MKIKEIIAMPDQVPDDSIYKNFYNAMQQSTEVSSIGEYKLKYTNDGSVMGLFLESPNGDLASCCIFKVLPNDTLQVHRVHTFGKHSGKSLAVKLYAYVVNEGFTVLSDEGQSNMGKDLWTRRLPNAGINVLVYDTSTGKYHTLTDIPIDQVYGNKRYLLAAKK